MKDIEILKFSAELLFYYLADKSFSLSFVDVKFTGFLNYWAQIVPKFSDIFPY